jgi:hypothetical protein
MHGQRNLLPDDMQILGRGAVTGFWQPAELSYQPTSDLLRSPEPRSVIEAANRTKTGVPKGRGHLSGAIRTRCISPRSSSGASRESVRYFLRPSEHRHPEGFLQAFFGTDICASNRPSPVIGSPGRTAERVDPRVCIDRRRARAARLCPRSRVTPVTRRGRWGQVRSRLSCRHP